MWWDKAMRSIGVLITQMSPTTEQSSATIHVTLSSDPPLLPGVPEYSRPQK